VQRALLGGLIRRRRTCLLESDYKNKQYDLVVENFKGDLDLGKSGEKWVDDRLHSNVEVKTECDKKAINWRNSGNIIIEYHGANGRDSGIAVTEAETWVQVLNVDGEPLCAIMFDTERLKQYLRDNWSSLDKVTGGDGKRAGLIKLPLKKLLELS
jgi:hypothetical protein